MEDYRPRMVYLRSMAEVEEEMVGIGVDPEGLEAMTPKALLRVVKLYGVPAQVARQLKSVMLQLGGEVALPSGAYFSQDGPTDILAMGTLSEFTRLSLTLRAVPESMPEIIDIIDSAIRTFDESRGTTACRDTVFEWGSRTYVMGIINATPDSFSGEGLGSDVSAAVEQARRFVEEGVDILDVGGESTRPGHTPVDVDEESRRVLPVVEALAREFAVPISVDTYKAEVARRAVDVGASMINDVWALRADPEMAQVAAKAGVPVVLMHNQQGTDYDRLMDDIIKSLAASVDNALQAGISSENIIIDPGMGFGKTWQQNLLMLRRLAELKSLGRPILIGPSRKATIGKVLGLDVQDRQEGTAALVALSIQNGADIVRVHDVREMVRVSKMTDAVVRG